MFGRSLAQKPRDGESSVPHGGGVEGAATRSHAGRETALLLMNSPTHRYTMTTTTSCIYLLPRLIQFVTLLHRHTLEDAAGRRHIVCNCFPQSLKMDSAEGQQREGWGAGAGRQAGGGRAKSSILGEYRTRFGVVCLKVVSTARRCVCVFTFDN